MERIYAKSVHSQKARALVESLQGHFAKELTRVSAEAGSGHEFAEVQWLRNAGRHGGGNRFVQVETDVFNRAAINVSGIHYDDMPEKGLASADALSTIIHPNDPRVPSVHMHFSWTEMRNGDGYFRLMADLNPANDTPRATEQFAEALRGAAPEQYEEAAKQGDKYFYIPALQRHRGATHFYLEGFSTGDFAADLAFTRHVAEAAIASYIDILSTALAACAKEDCSAQQQEQQLAYHTLYLFQVLTLDRGTTSGLLVHDENDQGIMGSIPAYVDARLLASWQPKVPSLQGPLVAALVDALGSGQSAGAAQVHVDSSVRLRLAQAVRDHYKKFPEALKLQAAGNIIPPTVANHR